MFIYFIYISILFFSDCNYFVLLPKLKNFSVNQRSDLAISFKIILTDRRNDIFQNVTFCQKGCSYSGINYELTTVNCICDSSSLQGENVVENYNTEDSENLNFKSITKTFASSLLDFNIDVIFCYNLVFDFQRLVKNIGFYLMSIMLILQIIFLCIFLIKKLNPIKEFMLKFYNSNYKGEQTLPNKKYKLNNDINKRKLTIKKGENNFKNIIKNEKVIKKELLKPPLSSKLDLMIKNVYQIHKNNFLYIKNFAPTINIIESPDFNNNKVEKNLSKSNIKKTINSIQKNPKRRLNVKRNNNDLSYKEKLNNSSNNALKNKKLNHFGEKDGNKYKKNNKGIKNNIIDDEDLLDMEYNEAIIKDRSTWLRIFWAFLVDSQIILTTFFTKNYLELFVIKLSFCVFSFQINFFLNALFYTDDYIKNKI